MSRQVFSVVLIIGLLTSAALSQTLSKPWTEWSRKEAEKILTDSPWAQTQTETDISELFFRPQAAPNAITGARNSDPARDERGANNQATSIKYYVRFLSAKPVRLAIARQIELDQPADERVRAYLKDFVERRFDRWIAITVTFTSSDGRLLGAASQAFNSAVTSVLKNNTYLERKDGKRLFLHTYQAPSADGLGAKFIFEREVDSRPFLNIETGGDVRFVSEVSKTIKLERRFKLSEMVFEGKLEY